MEGHLILFLLLEEPAVTTVMEDKVVELVQEGELVALMLLQLLVIMVILVLVAEVPAVPLLFLTAVLALAELQVRFMEL